jgi:tetratricopeptide (TPR) repeat protein
MAGELYAEAIKQDTFHANNLCNYGLFLSEEKGKYALAEELYKRALTHSPRHANTLYNYAVMLDSHLGRKHEAEDLYRRSLEVEPKHAFALYNLAVLLEDKVSAQERSEDRLAKQQAGGGGGGAGGQAPPTIEARLVKRQEVAALYARAVDCDPKDATTTADYGRYLLTRIEDADKAEEVLFKAAQLDPDNAVAVYNLALLLHRHRGNLSGAEALLSKLAHKHVASLQLLARVQLDKFRASQDQRDLEDCLLNFQRAMEQLKDPALCMLEYLKVVLESGSNRQRVRAMGAVEACMGAKKVARETDVRAMINNVKKLAEKAA